MERVRRRGQAPDQAVAELLRLVPAPTQTDESRQAPVTGQAGDKGPVQPGTVQVISGASVQSFPIAGMRVEHARGLLNTILRLDPQGPVLVNGRRASGVHRLEAGDVLELVHHAGEKGAVHARADRDH
jgi:hypothetical protein